MNSNSRRETLAVSSVVALAATIFVGSSAIPSLLDDADSFYAEVAREMNLRSDWITPYANQIRFLEKPPLFYWLISLSYKIFGTANAFTARLPTALTVTALVFVTFKIGKLLFGQRAALFGALALATSFGTFLFTRIILPDALFTLLLSLILYSFLRWQQAERKTPWLLWLYGFAGFAVMARGLIGLVFPGAIIFITLAVSKSLKEGRRLFSLRGCVLFLAIAVPWHVLIGTRNPGFFWFYFINEHLLRFLGKRYPMDYGTVPLVPFWVLHLVWLFPWSIYLATLFRPRNLMSAIAEHSERLALPFAWALTILVFFSFSTRLEYYTLPALPAFCLLAGVQCARFWESGRRSPGIVAGCVGAVIGVGLIAIAVAVSGRSPAHFLSLTDNPELYAYYLGHIFDLTSESFQALRWPLVIAGLGIGIGLPVHALARRPGTKAAALALGMTVFFFAADLGFFIFAPRLTSEPLAREITGRRDGDSAIVIDGEYEEGCSLAFYTARPVLIHHAPTSNLEYGSHYPDAPDCFIDDEQLRRIWIEKGRRVYLLTFQSKMAALDSSIAQSSFTIAQSGDKILLSNLQDVGTF